ncbi:MobA-like NTP transferase domain-containing protein [Bordetella sputigena]|uniref:NTP transferase domain-containing protein n=1 Tax=Bordetella sputigena TaxID=1416810 RepID=UPI0039EFF74B
MSAVTHAVIAAAGLGSRLGLGLPKCLLEIDGRTLLERQLELLQDVPDVRIVVGFDAETVIAKAREFRSDLIFVRNAAFRSTTTLTSYAMGAAGLDRNCLFMDADILFEPTSFAAFLKSCETNDLLVAVTDAKTTDAVYTHLREGFVTRFSRTEQSDTEWANLCWLPPGYCETGEGAVFERLSGDLPIRCHSITSFEIDTPADQSYAMANATFR